MIGPRQLCADCDNHQCSMDCAKKPRKSCTGVCKISKQKTICYKSGKKCKHYVPVKWR